MSTLRKDCYICDNTEPNYFNRCKKHDVCIKCGKARAELKDIPWGGKEGFICQPCQTAEWKANIAAFDPDSCDPSDFEYRDDIKCPYCGHEYYPSDLHESTDDEDCPNCNSIMCVEIEYEPKYTVVKKKYI